MGEGLEQPHHYHPATHLRDPVLLERALALPVRKQRALAELLSGKMCKHTLYLTKRAETVASSFDLGCVPFFHRIDRLELLEQMVKSPETAIRVVDATAGVEFYPGLWGHRLVEATDGERPTIDILRVPYESQPHRGAQKVSTKQLFLEFHAMYSLFNSVDWMFQRKPAANPGGA